MRVYEIAKEVGIPNKELLAKIRSLGLEVNNHMSSLNADDVARIKKSLERERTATTSPVESQKVGAGSVIRRRSTRPEEEAAAAPPVIPAPPPLIRRRVVEDTAHAEPARGHAAEPVRVRPDAHEHREHREAQRPTVAPAAERHAEPAFTRAPAGRAESQRFERPPVDEPPAREPARDADRDEPAAETGVGERAPAGGEAARQRELRTFDRSNDGDRGDDREDRRDDDQASEPASARAPAIEVEDRVSAEDDRASARTSDNGDRGDRGDDRAASERGRDVEAPAEPRHERAASPPPAAQRPEPRTRVFVAGPSIGRQGGASSSGASASGGMSASGGLASNQSAEAPPLPMGPRPTVIVRPHGERPSAPQGPVTVEEVATTARSRFEIELERARARSAERAAERPAPVVEVVAPVAPPVEVQRDPSRPAVGTVIKLPTRIQITERAAVGGRPAPAKPPGPPGTQIRGRFAEQQAKGGPKGGQNRDFGKKKLPFSTGKGKGQPTIRTTPAEHKRVIRMEETIAIGDLARGMGVKATEVLKKLWSMGMAGVTINASIDFETAQILASEFGYEVQNVAFKEQDIFAEAPDEASTLVHRAPVVTVMGHVDHGKTSLLDKIRNSKVAAGESGGITQHIAAYKVPAGANHGEIVFLDTPGHEAFTEMRARGAQATDVVILVVAANDGVMPQTLEALSHAKDAKVPIIVAVNKIDLADAQPDRIRQQLADHGLIPEEWGGETQYVNVSALKGDNIDKLLETIALVAEVAELRANPAKPASGLVIEARLDRNRGPMASILVQEGTLKVGDILVAGRTYGKVRAMLDARGETLKEAGPSTPIEILGLDGVPEAGDQVNVAEDDKAAKQVVEHRRQAWRRKELSATTKVSLENLMERMTENASKELKIVLKADVQGSAEAIKAALVKLSTEKVRVLVIATGVGGITESDVNLAKAGGAIIVGFHVRPAGKSAKLAEQEEVQIRLYDIIYDALDEVKLAMAGLLAPIKREQAMGKLEVRDTFTVPKIGTVAGCWVSSGKVTRKALLRIIRDAVQVYEGRVGSLRRFKDDVSEVQAGYECGVMVAGYNDLKIGDVIEAYEVIEEAATL